MPDEHLGAIDHTRHDSVDVHSVSLRYLVVTRKTGCNSHSTEFSRYTKTGCNLQSAQLGQLVRVVVQACTWEPAIFEDNVCADERSEK